MRSLQRDARLVGRAGEYTVAAQLLLRDVVVYWPSVDLGCDLETENHCRIQVKTGHLTKEREDRGRCYEFRLPKVFPVPSLGGASRIVSRKKFAEVCDFVVFWGIEQNRFWIIPAHLCDDSTGMRLGYELSTRPRLVTHQAAVLEMVGLGYSQEQIAKHYGVTRSTIQRFISNRRDWSESTVSQMRSCENAWHSIIEFGKSATQELEPLEPTTKIKLEER